jgi:hypothetical protein
MCASDGLQLDGLHLTGEAPHFEKGVEYANLALPSCIHVKIQIIQVMLRQGRHNCLPLAASSIASQTS